VTRRVLHFAGSRLLVLLGAATVAFLALHLLSGDPVAATLGALPSTPEIVTRVRAELGVDEPFLQQYAEFIGRLVTGDLGTSYQLDRPVIEVIGEQLGSTLVLAGTSAVLGFATALAVALSTTGPRRRTRRLVASAAELTVVSTPTFWLGILLLTAFSFRLKVFPVVGDEGGVQSLVLPAVTLALPVAAVLTQVLRGELDHALTQPFALTARAHGLRESAVRRLALRHALLPVTTLAGWFVGSLMSGAVLVETIFGRPGVGRVTAQAVTNGDLPVVVGVVLLSAVTFVVLSAAVEVLYRAIDPRLRVAT
jgi:peptide/nickel transport system permease protein